MSAPGEIISSAEAAVQAPVTRDAAGRPADTFPEPGASWRMVLVAALVSAALSLVVYAGSLRGELGHWDDSIYVTENPLVLNPSAGNVWRLVSRPYFNHWYPVTMLTYVADYAVWGLTPLGYHLTSLLFHAAAGVLAFCVLRRLSRSDAAALFATAVFVAHPTAVESVAWISERKNVVCLVLWLGAYLLYLRADPPKRRPWEFALAVALSALACMSKAQGVTLAAVVGLTELLVRRSSLVRSTLVAAPFGVISAAFVALNMATATGSMMPEYWGGSLLSQMTTNIGVLLEYVRMMVIPCGLSPVYELHIWRHPLESLPVAALGGLKLPLPLLAAILLGAIVWGTIRLSRERALAAFLWGFFLVNLLPVLNLVPIPWLMQDRYLYFPSVGAALLVALVARDAAGRILRDAQARRTALLSAATVLLAAHAAMATVWAGKWSRPRVLWYETAARRAPNSFASWYGSGDAARHSMDWGTAALSYERARTLARGSYLKFTRAKLAVNLGGCLFNLGQTEEGLAYTREAADELPKEPIVVALVADIFLQASLQTSDRAKRLERARTAGELLDRAFGLYEPTAAWRLKRAQTHQVLGEYDEALALANKVVEENPRSAEAYSHLGSILDDMGRTEEAIDAWKKGMALGASPVFDYNLGVAMERLGRYDEAMERFSRVEIHAKFTVESRRRMLWVERARRAADCPGSGGAW